MYAYVIQLSQLAGIKRVDIRSDGTVTIVAESQMQADAARLQLEMVSDTVAIQEDDVGWIIGKGGKTVRACALEPEMKSFFFAFVCAFMYGANVVGVLRKWLAHQHL